MHDQIKRKLEMLARVREFGIAHSDRFPAGSRGDRLFTELAQVVTKLQQLAGAQASGRTTGRNLTVSKIAAKAAVVDDLEAINLNARAMGVTTPGLEDKFRLPRSTGDQAILASARAFLADALPLKDQFIALDMPADFLDRLNVNISAFEVALSQRRTSRSSLINSTAAMDAALADGLDLVQQLAAVVQNKIGDDEALIAEWFKTSRTERRHRSISAPTTPPAGTEHEQGSGSSTGETHPGGEPQQPEKTGA